MSKSGLTIKTPDIAYEALESAFEESGPTPVLKARELKTATADVRCENEGNWSNQLRDREGADAAEVMKSQAAFILHAQQVDKRDLAQLSSSKR